MYILVFFVTFDRFTLPVLLRLKTPNWSFPNLCPDFDYRKRALVYYQYGNNLLQNALSTPFLQSYNASTSKVEYKKLYNAFLKSFTLKFEREIPKCFVCIFYGLLCKLFNNRGDRGLY